ncbi:TetR/AcrR family transcriptional regulator [Saxibacter everestensis]|uniref:TetR/AcrR family transcriptional regulator n=1 Tax=Saxibacter everestensis TaxID=2909229 RepID=A0ABY8QYY8_9MICO|nr:TetR/AcrR family transcriptional regulator [Brevibacteriaceae bacterium ZFBP1038]
MARPRTQLLSREIILDAALELIRTQHDFTIVGIGKHLGVNPSSLYHHISGGKDEIINALRERIYKNIDLRSLQTRSPSWQSKLAAWVRAYREAVAQNPAAIPILIGQSVDDAPTLAIYEALASILSEAAIPEDQHLGVISMLDSLVFGSAIDAGSPEPLWDTTAEGQPNLHRAVAMTRTPDRVTSGLEMGIQAAVSYIERLVEESSTATTDFEAADRGR